LNQFEKELKIMLNNLKMKVFRYKFMKIKAIKLKNDKILSKSDLNCVTLKTFGRYCKI